MSLKIRAKTIIKLESQTVSINLEMQKGNTLNNLIKNLLIFIDTDIELDELNILISERKKDLSLSAQRSG